MSTHSLSGPSVCRGALRPSVSRPLPSSVTATLFSLSPGPGRVRPLVFRPPLFAERPSPRLPSQGDHPDVVLLNECRLPGGVGRSVVEATSPTGRLSVSTLRSSGSYE